MPVSSQFRISDLQDSVRKANTSRAKADAYFNLSRAYSEALLKIDSSLIFANKVKEYSLQDNYERGLGQYHFAVSKAIYFRNTLKESKDHADTAAGIFIKLKDDRLLGMTYLHIGMIQNSTGNSESALSSLRKAIQYLQIAGDERNLYQAFFWMARQYEYISIFDSSAEYYFKSLQLAERLQNAYRIYVSSTELGVSFLRLNDLPNAYKYLDYGLKSRTPTTDRINLRETLGEYAICLAMMRDFNKADSAIIEFDQITKKFNDLWGLVTSSKIKGILAYEKGHYPEALNYLRRAYHNMDGNDMPLFHVKDIVFNLGKSEFQTGLYDSAIVHLREAAQISQQVKSWLNVFEAYLLLSESFSRSNKPDSALYYFRNYSLVKDSVLSLQKQQAIIEVTTRYETGKKEQEIRMLEKESEANSYLLQLRNQQIEKQQLENDKKTQQLALVSQQNEISQLDASQKALNLENEKKENEKNQAKLKLLEREAAYQKLLAAKQDQQKKNIFISIACILALGGAGIYRYIQRKKFQSQQEVSNERLRISRELHDEVGSTLTGIAMYSHLTKEQLRAAKTADVEKSLNNIQQSAGDMVNKLSDIVWLVNPEKDSLHKLIERLEQYAEMAMIKSMEIKITVSPKLENINLPMESRRNLYLFCKEAINNAVKYSDANLLEISLRESDNKKIEILVSDNGKGFDLAALKNENGLINMRERVAAMGGEYLLKTSPGQGTKVGLNLKIT